MPPGCAIPARVTFVGRYLIKIEYENGWQDWYYREMLDLIPPWE